MSRGSGLESSSVDLKIPSYVTLGKGFDLYDLQFPHPRRTDCSRKWSLSPVLCLTTELSHSPGAQSPKCTRFANLLQHTVLDVSLTADSTIFLLLIRLVPLGEILAKPKDATRNLKAAETLRDTRQMRGSQIRERG